MIVIKGASIVPGRSKGQLLVSLNPISFLGMVDPVKGEIVAGETNLINMKISGSILAFPYMVGSTVAPYVIYRMKKLKTSPAAIVVQSADPSLASGCALTEIPLIDHIDISSIYMYNLRQAEVDGESGALVIMDDKNGMD